MAGAPVRRARRQAAVEVTLDAATAGPMVITAADLEAALKVGTRQAGRDDIRSLLQGDGSVCKAVREALAAMTWLGPADIAMKTLALEYAAYLDAPTIGPEMATKLGVRLEQVLDKLGGSPAPRKALGVEGGKGGSKLAHLRAVHGGGGQQQGASSRRRSSGRSA